MKSTVPRGLTPICLLLLAALLGTLISVSVPFLFAKEDIKFSDWLGFSGSFLGAMVTLVAAAYAWRAVQAQLELQSKAVRLALISREEDRIDKDRPAFEDEVDLLLRLLTKLDYLPGRSGPEVELGQAGLLNEGGKLSISAIASRLPLSSEMRKRRIFDVLTKILDAEESIKTHSAWLDHLLKKKNEGTISDAERRELRDELTSNEAHNDKSLVLRGAIEDFRRFTIETIEKADLLRDRNREFRDEIEREFSGLQ